MLAKNSETFRVQKLLSLHNRINNKWLPVSAIENTKNLTQNADQTGITTSDLVNDLKERQKTRCICHVWGKVEKS